MKLRSNKDSFTLRKRYNITEGSMLEVISKFHEGDEFAFVQIYYLLYGPLLYSTLIMINDAELAEDITKETFIKLYNLRGNFDTIYTIKAFLYTTSKNSYLDHLKYTASKS